MSENLLERQLVAAVRFARQGDKAKARPLLEAILKEERSNEQAWIWLAAVVDGPRERRACFERILKLNPKNAPAQAALNAMVGVLGAGEQPNIDYEAMSKAAAKPLPTTGTRRETPAPPRNLATGTQRTNLRPWLIAAAVGLGILFLLTIFPPSGLFTDELAISPTAEVAELTEEPSATVDPLYTPPSPTIAPTATFNGTFVPVTRQFELPPTYTPTVTPTATNTPTATATLPGLSNYNWLFLATQGTSLPAIYRINGGGDGLEVLIANINEFDFDIPTGLIAFTEPQQLNEETGNARIISRMFLAPIGNLAQRTEITSTNMPNAISPALSPDGTKLAFASDADGDNEIYVYEIASASLRKLTNNTFDDIDPDWSPTGSNIIYASNIKSIGRHQIFNMSATDADAEANAVQVTDLSSDNTNPSWSPGSSLIVFTSQDNGGNSIIMSDVNGSFFRDLTFVPSYSYSEPSWTLDGFYAVFTAGAEGDGQSLHLVPALAGPEITLDMDEFVVSRIVQR